jgi:alkylation response protein AidB-like acyl-CoA dehydrogenase
MASHLLRALREATLRLSGAQDVLMGDDAPLGGMMQWMALFSPAISLAGGTDEVQRNIIGERVLGLPPESRPDKELPFDQVPGN